jgi:hypothetical protein
MQRVSQDVLVLMDADQAAGVAAHRSITIQAPDRSSSVGSYLRVLALTNEYQGSRLPTGERLSDVFLQAAINDACSVNGRASVVTARVAQDNAPSRRLCHRIGFTESHIERLPDYHGITREYVVVDWGSF